MTEPIVIYKTYHPSQKKAYHSYVEKNREKVNERQRENYRKMRENPNFDKDDYNRRKREYYRRKKEEKDPTDADIKEALSLKIESVPKV
jgi:hypothetical protein